MSKVIAINFDETITDNTPYPIIGNLTEAINILNYYILMGIH